MKRERSTSEIKCERQVRGGNMATRGGSTHWNVVLYSPLPRQPGRKIVEEQIASAAASPHGTAPKFDNLRSHIRRMSRNATKREIAAGSAAGTPGGKRRAADVEDGEISDGGASCASRSSSGQGAPAEV